MLEGSFLSGNGDRLRCAHQPPPGWPTHPAPIVAIPMHFYTPPPSPYPPLLSAELMCSSALHTWFALHGLLVLLISVDNANFCMVITCFTACFWQPALWSGWFFTNCSVSSCFSYSRLLHHWARVTLRLCRFSYEHVKRGSPSCVTGFYKMCCANVN